MECTEDADLNSIYMSKDSYFVAPQSVLKFRQSQGLHRICDIIKEMVFGRIRAEEDKLSLIYLEALHRFDFKAFFKVL